MDNKKLKMNKTTHIKSMAQATEDCRGPLLLKKVAFDLIVKSNLMSFMFVDVVDLCSFKDYHFTECKIFIRLIPRLSHFEISLRTKLWIHQISY